MVSRGVARCSWLLIPDGGRYIRSPQAREDRQVRRLEEPWETVVAITVGVAFALLVMVSIILFTGPHDPFAATTTTGPPSTGPTTTSTTQATTSTTEAPNTTQAGIDFADDTEPKFNDEVIGEPGPSLTDVRFGAHPGYARIVLDFTGEGTPAYRIEYQDPPFFTDGEGAEVDVDGEAFLVVIVSPGTTYDPDDMSPTYTGDHRLYPRLDPIVEMVLTGDFEAQLTWVIGLTGERGFRVLVLQSPLRIVIDIAT
jgi:hypothetical protein